MSKKNILYHAISLLILGELFCQEPITWSLNTSQGMPSNIVYSQAQDKLGNIWFATDNGMAYYNGTTIHKPQLPPVNDHFFAFIQEDGYGNIWMLNITGELLLYKNGDLSFLHHPIKDKVDYIKDIVIIGKYLCLHTLENDNKHRVNTYKISPDGDLSYHDSAAQIESSLLTVHNIDEELHISWLDNDTRNIFLKRFIKLEHLQVEKIKTREVFISIEKLGKFYVGLNREKSKVILFDKDKVYDEVAYDAVLSQLILINEVLYLATHKGYRILKVSGNKILSSPVYLSQLKINSIFNCRENLLWVATYNDGVHVIPNENNKSFKALHALGRESGIPAITANDSMIYFGTSEGELYSLYQDRLEKRASLDIKITALKRFNKELYLSTARGIYKFDPIKNTVIQYHDGVIKDFEIPAKGYYAISTSSAFKVHKFDPIKNKSKKIHVLSSRSYACLLDNHNVFWVGNINGLYFLDDFKNSEANFSKSNLNYNISDIEQYNDSTVYVSTFAHGLYKFVNYKLQNKVNSPYEKISDLSSDGKNLLLATDEGALYYDVENDVINPITKKNLISSNNVESVLLEKDHIWVGTDNGLNRISKNSLSNTQNIILTINKVKVDGDLLTINEDIEIERDVKTIQISFAGISNKRYQDMNYRYQLIGLDTSWVDSKNSELSFSNLDHGNYQLNLIATDGQRFSNTSILKFHIPPYWYEHLAAKILFGILGFTLLFYLAHWRLSRKIQKVKKKNANQKLIEGMQMTALQNHMNPHFISNALYTIQDLISNNNNWEASEYTSNFAGMIRQSMLYASKERISLKEEMEFLKLYLELESMRFKKKIKTNIHLDQYLQEHKSEIMIPPLLIQPLIENSFKHGNLNKMDQPYVSISLKHTDKMIIAIVEDNGIGFKSHESQAKGSTGLKTISERLKLNAKQLERDIMLSGLFVNHENDICKIRLKIDY